MSAAAPFTPLARADWFASVADMYWQWPDGETALRALCAAKEPTDDSPETAEDLTAWLDAYVAYYGHSDKDGTR